MSAGSASVLERVAGIAREAGREILEVYAAGAVASTAKADDSPLTAADLRSHRLIVQRLRELTPELPVLSEEAADVPFAVRSRWPRYWLVDPLDGTREFLSRNGEFTVNIALIEGHAPALGIVHVPVTDTTYRGLPGEGAWRERGGAPAEPIRVAAHSAAPLRVVGSRSHRGHSLDAFLARVGAHELVAIGSSLKFCRVAEGAIDVYPRLSEMSEWDIAAGHALVTAAGGLVTAPQGSPLRYGNAAQGFCVPGFIVWGDPSRRIDAG